MRIDIYRRPDKQWMIYLKSPNHKIILWSERYKEKRHAIRMAKLIASSKIKVNIKD